MNAPRARQLLRLDQALEASLAQGQQLQAHALRAQRAILLIRQGQLDAARDDLTVLHQASFANPSPVLGAWLHLAEGLMAYYTDFGDAADERLQRALALAQAARCRPVLALGHAFLGLIAFTRADGTALRTHLRAGFEAAEPDDLMARARLNLVAAIALHHGGDAAAAQPWYAKARSHASRLGDDATVSAVIHNSTHMRVAEARRAELTGQGPSLGQHLLHGLLPGVESSLHYDQAMGMASLEVLTPLLRAQVLVVTGDYAQALSTFEAHLPEALATGLERLGSSLLADVAWCRAQLGQHALAAAQARESELELTPQCHDDDLAATCSRLAMVYRLLGQATEAERLQTRADAAWAAFARHQQELLDAVRAAGLIPA